VTASVRASVRATPLGAAFDLLAAYEAGGGFFEREGSGVATGPLSDGIEIGPSSDLRTLAAATIDTVRALGAPDGVVPLAVGALPFAPGPASMWIPRRTVARGDDGETWLLDVADEVGAAPFRPERVVGDLPHEAFLPVQLAEEPTAGAYAAAVRSALALIEAGELDKVVLARTLRVDAGRDLDPRRLLHRLRAVEPHCFTFAAPTWQGPPSSITGSNREVPAKSRRGAGAVHASRPGTLVGASPELLLSRRGRCVRSVPLAGTAPRSGDPDEDLANAKALSDSAKEREEHAIVVAAVEAVLGGYCDDLAFDAEPVLEPTANVWHLATRFEGVLRDPAVTALDLVAELHPTPAVCGAPSSAARACIEALEPFDRGAYAGPVGWVDARGDGDWAIALRCAALERERATLYAGAGIVAGSDPAREVEETDRKFRAFLDSLRWG
jgi:isochorismate synthase